MDQNFRRRSRLISITSRYRQVGRAIALVCAVAYALAHAGSQSEKSTSPVARRITSIDTSHTFLLHNNTRPAVLNRLAKDLGAVPNSQRMPRMSIHFSLTPAQTADLTQLLAAQQNRRSPQYRQFLTPEEFGNRFGLGSADLDTVQQWLENSGFSNIQVTPAKTSISFSGNAGQAESAFHVRIHKYTLANESILANMADPELPKALENVVQSVAGLSTLRPVPLFTDLSCGINCNYVAPDDWETIYDVKPVYGAGFDGTGVKIAVLGQSDVQLSDLRAFRAAANLPPKDPTIVIPPGDSDPGFQPGDQIESNLDLEWAGAIAKNADVVFVTASATTGNGVFDSLSYAINYNIAPVINISYGVCEAQLSASDLSSTNTLLAQAAAQGITMIAASGDNGGAACDANSTTFAATHGLSVSFPASSPYVTGIGGTSIQAQGAPYWGPTNNSSNGSALSYIPEQVWNDGYDSASGGGASAAFSKPSWQQGLGVPNDNQRDVPDLAFTASPRFSGLLFCGPNFCSNQFYDSVGHLDTIGGTSAAAPPFSGLIALLVHKTGSRIGNINPNLYSLAQISSNTFHDITIGNSGVYCPIGSPDCPPGSGQLGFSAGVGYDQATGWGSVDANNLVEQWSGDIALAASPTSLTVTPGSSATTTITVSPQNNFTGPVSFSCSVSSSLIDVTCNLPATTVNTSGSVTLTIAASNNAKTGWFRRFRKAPPSLFLQTLLWLVLLALIVAPLKSPRSWRTAPLWLCIALFVMTSTFLSCGGNTGSGASKPSVAPLAVSCNMPDGLVQVSYTGSCTATGGTPPFTFTSTPGYFWPAGLVLNSSSGAISGSPTYTNGQITLSITASDSEVPPQSASALVNNFVVAGKLTLACYIPTSATTGTHVQTRGCSYGDGLLPVTTTVSAGALPPGLTWNSQSGVLSGIPNKPGTYAFTLTAVDSFQPPQTATENDTMVLAPPAPLQVLLNSLLMAQANVASIFPISVNGGVPPYSFSISSGALPAGLVLNQTGIITGVPQASGTSNYSLTVTDSYSPQQSLTMSGTIIVTPPPAESGTVTVTATSGGIANAVTVNVSVPAQTP